MPDNTALQISVLKRLWKRQLNATPPQLTVEALLVKAAGAGAVMEDGSEVIAVAFEGGSTQATVRYPKEVVMAAALDLLDDLDAGAELTGANPNVVHSDFSFTRVET